MTNLWSTKDLLGRDEREFMVCCHRPEIFYFKSLIRLFKRGIIPKKIEKVITPPTPWFA